MVMLKALPASGAGGHSNRGVHELKGKGLSTQEKRQFLPQKSHQTLGLVCKG